MYLYENDKICLLAGERFLAWLSSGLSQFYDAGRTLEELQKNLRDIFAEIVQGHI